MGLLQANEVIKLVAGIGEPLIGRLLLYDSLGTRFTELKVRRDPECPICGPNAEEIPESEMGKFPDYERSAPASPRAASFPADADDQGPTRAAPAAPTARPRSRSTAAPSATRSSALAERHPGTKEQLFSPEGELNRYVNVYLNDEDVRVLDGLDTSAADSDTVVILPAMAGGAIATGRAATGG